MPQFRIPSHALPISLIAVLATGCATVDEGLTQLDPPAFRLLSDPIPTVTVYPTHVTVKNGAGETLMDQDARSGAGNTANPDRSKLDGKLVITTRWDNGTSTTQILDHEAGKLVDLGWDGKNYYLKPTPQPNKTAAPSTPASGVEVAVGKAGIEDGRPGMGVRNPLGTETPLHKGPSRVDATRLDLSFPIRKLWGYDARLGFRFESGDESNGSRVEVGDGTSGVTYHGAPPGGSSTGLNYGGTGAESTFSTDINSQKISLNLFKALKDTETSDILFEMRLALERALADYDGRVQNLSFADIFSDHNQEVETYGISDGIGLRGLHTFTNGMKFGAGIGVELKYFWSDYKGSQHNVCGVCGGGEADFTIRTKDSKNRLTWGAWLDMELAYPVSKRGDLFLRADYRYQHDSPVLYNPVSPGDRGPHLGTDKLGAYGVQIGFRYTF